ncbi:MAG: class II fructose-bisphosphate aldolase, partial [Lachnospiraceae bacterium]|nr:class II fructose-bisphosphate aldolase [Lachnospiraceae bacterium]
KMSRSLTGMPLVLHGGTGISEGDFKRCIEYGIRKINVATATFMAVEQAAREYVSAQDKRDYFALSNHMVQEAYENVKKHMLIFGSAGRA